LDNFRGSFIRALLNVFPDIGLDERKFIFIRSMKGGGEGGGRKESGKVGEWERGAAREKKERGGVF
jgi:hypothetical protein